MDNNNKSIKPKKIRKIFSGTVVSHKMNKTLVIKVDRVKMHPKYRKRYRISKKYQVHDEENKHKTGDRVNFIECRPLSKQKRWRVI